jgi:hypothetical protein
MSNIATTLTSSLHSIGAKPVSLSKQESSDSDGDVEDLNYGQQEDMKISKMPHNTSRQDSCDVM